MLLSLSGATRSAPGIDRGDFLKHGMETGEGKAKRKSIPGKLLQDPNTVSFISEGPAVKYNPTLRFTQGGLVYACGTPKCSSSSWRRYLWWPVPGHRLQ